MTEETPKKLSRSERFVNYAKGIGMLIPALLAIGGLALGAIANLRGEPDAEKGYATLAESVNRMKKDVIKLIENQRKLHLRMVSFQGKEEGWNASKIHSDLLQCKAEVKPKPRRSQPGDLYAMQKKMLDEQKLKRKVEEQKVRLLKKLTKQQPASYKPLPKSLDDVKKRSAK